MVNVLKQGRHRATPGFRQQKTTENRVERASMQGKQGSGRESSEIRVCSQTQHSNQGSQGPGPRKPRFTAASNGKTGFRTGNQRNQGSQPDTASKPGFTGPAQSQPGFRGPKTTENRVQRERKRRKQGSQTRKRANQGSNGPERAEPGFPGSGAAQTRVGSRKCS